MSNSIMKKTLFLIVLTAFISLFTFENVHAQTDVAEVTGTVTDSQGAAVAGATVTITNPSNGFTRTSQTTDNGTYRFPGLPPGTYNVSVEQSGFKKTVQSDVQAPIASVTRADVTLETGDVSETVTVTSDTIDAVINTQDASIGNTFRPIQIQQLPTDSRNVADLLSLQPGVTREGYVNGGRSDQANITLDGVDVNDQQLGTAFSSVLRATSESVEEFRVTTTNANANQGRSSGAQISLLTKSGSNEFHGAGFWLPRRTFGSANNFFNNSADQFIERPNIDRDVFGGAIGGPIKKDKVFFFYSYEGWRQNPEVPTVQTVPLASLGQGILRFEDATGAIQTITPAQFLNYYPVAGQNPAALAVLAAAAARYPANDLEAAGDGLNTGGYRFNAPTSYEQNTHVLRLDWNINESQRLFARGNKQHDVSLNVPAFPDTLQPEDWDHNTGVVVGHSWAISTNKTNDFRYGLTRQAYTRGGDSNTNSTSFRFVYTPQQYSYHLDRVTPVQNITDDFTWIAGNHTFGFGGNVRIIRNTRNDVSPSYDNATINPSFYAGSGRSLLQPLVDNGFLITNTDLEIQSAVAALIGRFSQYTANYNYDINDNLLPLGANINRQFATEEYEAYVQDSWKMSQNFTVNLGLRYSLSRPVYEKNGYQVVPNIPLGDYFNRRVESAANGIAYNEPINFIKAGPANNAPGFYKLDKNNFQPRVSAAWSPGFKSGFLGKLFGKDNESVFRGGFAMTNDYFGQQLAVTFSNLSTLGFLTSNTTPANTFDVDSNLGPLFTGFGQQVRGSLPGVPPLPSRYATPADGQLRIEFSLDSTLKSPVNYSWNFTYGRKLPKGLYVEASYVGRAARNLLVQRDIMAPNNLRDPRSGTDWYTAAGRIYDHFYAGRTYDTISAIPYFENLFPTLGANLGKALGDPNAFANSTQAVAWLNEFGSYGDWTYLQALLDDGDIDGNFPGVGTWSNFFYQPQYGAFSAFSTVGNSDYHGGSLSIRQRFGDGLLVDFNYTLSKSMDDASGLQTSGAYGSAFVLNAIRQSDNYAVSDFDTRHVINANGLWQLPFGKNRAFFKDMNPVADAFLGGWQLGGIFRWNSGLPISNLVDLAGWATNWQIRSSAVRTRPIQTSINRGLNGGKPNLFSDLEGLKNSLRPPRPGETGDRNVFRGSSFSQLDMNLGKTFTMPWSETQTLQFRWEVFNVLNMQYFEEGSVANYTFIPADPFGTGQAAQPSLGRNTGQFTDIKGIPRRMQFVLRYAF